MARAGALRRQISRPLKAKAGGRSQNTHTILYFKTASLNRPLHVPINRQESLQPGHLILVGIRTSRGLTGSVRARARRAAAWSRNVVCLPPRGRRPHRLNRCRATLGTSRRRRRPTVPRHRVREAPLFSEPPPPPDRSPCRWFLGLHWRAAPPPRRTGRGQTGAPRSASPPGPMAGSG